jgi:hypothetical protein
MLEGFKMNNFATSLPYEGRINSKATTLKNSRVYSNALNSNIVEQHKSRSGALRLKQQANKRRCSPTIASRLTEMSNLKLAVFGSMRTAASIRLFISTLVFLGY